jgi:hypothetical protein
MIEPNPTSDGRTVTVRVAISIRRRGGQKLVFAPGGTPDTGPAICRRIDNAMVKAVARAFRWREMLENGTHATIAEIAAAEKINESYVGRVLRLTLLAPQIIEAILNGRQPAGLQLDALMKPFPVEWDAQSDALMAHEHASDLAVAGRAEDIAKNAVQAPVPARSASST